MRSVVLTGGSDVPSVTVAPCASNGIRPVWVFGKTVKRPQSLPMPQFGNCRCVRPAY